MLICFRNERGPDSVPVRPIRSDALETFLEARDERSRRWLTSSGFNAARDSFCLVPKQDGGLECVVAGMGTNDDLWSLGTLASTLPEGRYHLETDWPRERATRAAIGWGLGAYRFVRYREPRTQISTLYLDPAWDVAQIENIVDATTLARDLINTPAEDMMPEQLAGVVSDLATTYAASVRQLEGDALLDANYPAIHAVGRASTHAPRLIDLIWGDASKPMVTLVGKGVCFDSGGLDLKSAKGMRLMKKDMGGAAHAIALARLVMHADLGVRLRLLIPAVENAVSGNAYRPGDIIRTRQGVAVEIDNTDAEGRVILCDALSEASREGPALLLDFATLTGAARVALGTELPALFCNDDRLAEDLLNASREEVDEVWRLPLHRPYRELIESKFADIVNSATSPYGGAITAALFLKEFVPDEVAWAHFDVMGWNLRARPGRPEGGEAMGIRAAFRCLTERFPS